MNRRFQLVDVFGTEPFTGNPVAVIFDPEDLSTEDMRRITRWLNHSETTFLLPPTREDADYKLRIFSLAQELPFAGHPTLGTCHAWLEAGGEPKRGNVVIQECGAGLVEIRKGGAGLAFAAPPLLRGGTPTELEVTEVAKILQIDRTAIIDARWVDNGPGWIAVLLSSAQDVLAVRPVASYHHHVDIGMVGRHAPGGDAAFEIRAIFTAPGGTMIEDPVTGSLNASVGQWLFETKRAAGRYIAAQGTLLDRTGRIEVTQDENGQVWIGGRTLTLFSSVSAHAEKS